MQPILSQQPQQRSAAIAAGVAVAIGGAIALVPFFWATTFFTDDHLLLAFGRYAANPLVAFTRDQHGGEFYRPVSMTIWWLLARLGDGARWPFVLAGISLHVAVAIEVAWLLVAVGCDRRAAWTAAACFFLSPETREAALWFAALPDLLVTAALLGSVIALLRGRLGVSTVLAGIAFFCKESALGLPALALLMLIVRDIGGPRRWRRSLASVAPHAFLAVTYLAVRRYVLAGWGGTGDDRAPLVGRALQIMSGLAHSVAGIDQFSEAFAWGIGGAFLAVALFAAVRDARAGNRRALGAVMFVAVAVLPLFAVGWVIGARYFYLPAVGLAWLASEALRQAGPAPRVAVLVSLLALGGIHTLARHRDVADYDRRLAAARRAVAAGVAQGHRVFHIAGGIKDLDLAIKESPALRPWEDQILVLGDVPASFAVIPDALGASADFLVASPPLPPSGAYCFGSRRVVGLARRGDEPTLADALARFPDLRFIRLRPSPGGRVIPRDVTEEIRQTLD